MLSIIDLGVACLGKPCTCTLLPLGAMASSASNAAGAMARFQSPTMQICRFLSCSSSGAGGARTGVHALMPLAAYKDALVVTLRPSGGAIDTCLAPPSHHRRRRRHSEQVGTQVAIEVGECGHPRQLVHSGWPATQHRASSPGCHRLACPSGTSGCRVSLQPSRRQLGVGLRTPTAVPCGWARCDPPAKHGLTAQHYSWSPTCVCCIAIAH